MKRLSQIYFKGAGKSLVAVMLLFSLNGQSQDETLNHISASLRAYQNEAFSEKMYLQTDKSFYLAGEIIWFKSYTVKANAQQLLSLSKVAYVELLNMDNKPVLQGKISLQEGIGNGSFFIPLSLPSGSYKIRCYTNWMKNNGADYFFDKDLTIVNALKKSWDSVQIKKPGYDIQFFPEGGNLVDGITSVVGFKVTDENGKGIQTEGDIVDQNQKTVAHFQTQSFGMGRFTIVPSATDQYKVSIKSATDPLSILSFPSVYRKGYTLKLQADTGTVHVTINSNYDGENPTRVSAGAHKGRNKVYPNVKPGERTGCHRHKKIFTRRRYFLHYSF